MRLLQLLGWLLLLVGTAWFVDQTPSAAPSDLATALLAYPLDHEVRFSMESGEREFRVLSWLAHPPTWTRDPRVAHDYQLEAEVLDANGGSVWRRAWWISSRDAPASTHFEAGLERLTEDRMTTLRLEGAQKGRRLALRATHVQPGDSVLMVAWRLAQRPQAHQIRLLNGTPGLFHAAAAVDYGVPAWDSLSDRVRRATVEREWERLGALPDSGGLVPTKRLFTRFEHGQFRTDPRDAIPLPAGGAAAWNVQGPAVWTGRWQGLVGGAPGSGDASLRIVHEDGTAEVRELPGGEIVGPVEIGDELASIQVVVGLGSPTRRLLATLDGGEPWGDPPRHDNHVGPDLRRLEIFRTAPGDGGLRFPVPDDADVHVSIRARLPPTARAGLDAGPAVDDGITSIEALDASGTPLAAWSAPIPARASAFERPAGPDTPADAAVGDAYQAWIVPPVGTHELRVRADRTVDVAVRARPRLPFNVPPTEAYPRPFSLAARPRFVPEINDLWTACAPAEFATLVTLDRVIKIDAQVRLEPAEEAQAPAVVRTWTSYPIPGGTTLLAEPGASSGATSRLGQTAATIQSTGRLAIDYRVGAERAGKDAVFRIDEQLVRRTLPSATGSLYLQVGKAVRLAVDTPGLFLARAAGGSIWRRVRVAPLQPEQTLSVPVPRGEGAFSVQLYQSTGEAGTLEWRVEAPPIDPGVYPYLPLRHDEVPLGSGGGQAEGLSVPGTWESRAPILVWIPSPGATRLHLTLRGATRPAWVRLTSTWATRGAPRDHNVVRRSP